MSTIVYVDKILKEDNDIFGYLLELMFMQRSVKTFLMGHFIKSGHF